jgi:hypothetical protein
MKENPKNHPKNYLFSFYEKKFPKLQNFSTNKTLITIWQLVINNAQLPNSVHNMYNPSFACLDSNCII